jgi:citrate synthase
LVEARPLRSAARSALAALPVHAKPVDGLRTLLSAQGAECGGQSPSMADAIALTAVVPTAAAACYRRSQRQEPVEPRSDLGHTANFLYMLTQREPDPEAVRLLQTYLVVMADHALSPSTFTAQIVGSTGSDLWSAVIAALGALKGPAHGGAIAGAARMLADVGAAANAEEFVLRRLKGNERLMGFGHREYRRYDPRARILRELCKEMSPEFYEVAEAVENVTLRELAGRYPDRPNSTNVDYYASGLLARAGFQPDFFVCVFAAARAVGWTAHVLEYINSENRIVSPASEWIGPYPQNSREGSSP